MEMGTTRKSSGCNEEMSGSVVNDVLWEILLEVPNRQLDSPRLKNKSELEMLI